MARAFVRAGLSVAEIVELTRGAELIHRSSALDILAKYPAYWPPLRALLQSPLNRLREDAILALQNDKGARALLREGLWADQGRVRTAAVMALGGDSASIDALATKLEDRHGFVRSATARALAAYPERWGELRKRIEDRDLDLADVAITVLATDPPSLHSIREHLRRRLVKPASYHVDRAVEALRTDPLSRQLITDTLLKPKMSLSAKTLRALAEDPEWRELVRKRMDEGDRRAREALLSLPEFKSALQALLKESDEHLLIFAIDELSADPESVELIQPHLESAVHNVCFSAIKALSKHSGSRKHLRSFFRRTADVLSTPKLHIELLRAQVIQELAGDAESRPLIEEALADKDVEVRSAAVAALSRHSESRPKIRPLLRDKDWRVQVAAREALADEPGIREHLFSDLPEDQWPPRVVAFIMLANEAGHRQKMQEMLKDRSNIRISVFQPLSRDPDSLTLLYESFNGFDNDERLTLADLTRGDPRMKQILRGQLERLQSSGAGAYFFSLNEYAELLADDPASRPVLQKLFHDEDHNVVAAVAPAMARDPEARQRLVELLSSEWPPNVQAAAIKALAGDPEMAQWFQATLAQEGVDDYVRVAAIDALSTAPDARDLLRQHLNDPAEKVRDATFRALSKDPDSRGILWERLVEEEDDDLRAKIAETLATEPASLTVGRERLRACLADPVSRVRSAAARALCPSPPPPAVPLERVPSLRIALILAGAINERLSVAEYSLQERLAGFLKAPVPLALEGDSELAEALLGWLCTRLAWSAADGSLHTGRVFGEVSEAPVSLRTLSEPLVIRVAMDASELPKERFLHPMHNLIEAWQIARFLHARTPPALVLACADVALEDLSPPTLAPGQVCWGPCYFGFRLGTERLLDPIVQGFLVSP
jgi:HEAT repeat protein